MDSLTFIATIIDSLAWPIAIVAIAIFLKEGLIKLLPKLRQLKYKDLHLEFEQSIKEAIIQADEANLPALDTTKGHKQLKVDKHSLLTLAQSNPKEAFIKTWLRLESAIRQGICNTGSLSDSEKITVSNLPSKGASSLLLNQPKLFKYFETLQTQRDKVVHGEIDTVSIDSARYFIELSFRLILYIEDKWPNK